MPTYTFERSHEKVEENVFNPERGAFVVKLLHVLQKDWSRATIHCLSMINEFMCMILPPTRGAWFLPKQGRLSSSLCLPVYTSIIGANRDSTLSGGVWTPLSTLANDIPSILAALLIPTA